jgi:hypothetical protein
MRGRLPYESEPGQRNRQNAPSGDWPVRLEETEEGKEEGSSWMKTGGIIEDRVPLPGFSAGP